MNLVLFGKQYFHIVRNGPLDTDIGVVPHKSRFVGGIVIARALVNEFSLVGQNYKAVSNVELTVTIGPEPEAEPAQVPAEFVGTWKGKGDFGIELTVNILEDGSGSYAFEQRGYREEGEFSFSFTDSTFSLTNPNAALMTGAEGTYTLEDGVLTMDITSTLSNGSTYSYTVALTKID